MVIWCRGYYVDTVDTLKERSLKKTPFLENDVILNNFSKANRIQPANLQ